MSRIADKLRNNVDNQACADCGVPVTASMAWATITHGAFVCIQCAGVHRNLGVHVSRIKSAHMDTWTSDELELMKGNRAANSALEKHVTPAVKAAVSRSDACRVAYIQAKYALKTFASPNGATFQLPTTTCEVHPQQMPTRRNSAPSIQVDIAKRFVNYFVVVGRGSSLKQTGTASGYAMALFVKDVMPTWAQALSSGAKQASSVYSPKCLVVLSQYPFYSTFRMFLQQAPLPLERYVANFTAEIPVPPPVGAHRISRIILLCVARVNFRPLFQMLDLNNVLTVFTCLLLEQKAREPVFDPFAPEIDKADLAFDHQDYLTPIQDVNGTTGGRTVLHVADAERKASLSLDRKATLSFQTLKMLVPSQSTSVLAERSASAAFNNSTGSGAPSAVHHPSEALFDATAFLRDNSDAASRPFLATLIGSQVRRTSPQLPEVLFFDASIHQKLNRSVTLGKKHDVSFLEDKSENIRETFVAPPPSTMGLPDNGMRYKYRGFPRLKRYVFCVAIHRREKQVTNSVAHSNRQLFGTTRKPRELFTAKEQPRHVAPVDVHQQIYKLSTCVDIESVTFLTKWMVQSASCAADHVHVGTMLVQLQALYRMHRAQKAYRKQRAAVLAIQSFVSAHLKSYLMDLKHHIFMLWRDGAIPLVYRSKFWIMFDRADFMSIGVRAVEVLPSYDVDMSQVHLEEIARLQAILGYPKPAAANVRLDEERLHLYDQLKYHTTDSIVQSLYRAMGIPVTNKKKKRKSRICSDLAFTVNAAMASLQVRAMKMKPSAGKLGPLPKRTREASERLRQEDSKEALMRSMVYQNHCLEIQVAETQRELVKCRQLLAAAASPQEPTTPISAADDPDDVKTTGTRVQRRPSLLPTPQQSYHKLV
ncbi:hypothetical protein DYB32_007787 [Aphanomyces invadans]|uniref:Arf-GAP domain-containing protein n=1 Tax=Aphanomyces invadans TaxID=157072 RepID=A0A3R6Z0S1_9STRA|nr:hypothetical protein DYB32_007787 [Aphanomyces invadans]